MVFSSPVFLFVFLPVVLAGNFLLPKRARNLWLLIASLCFYAWGEPRFVLALIGSVALNYGFALGLERLAGRKGRRALLWAGVGCDLALLFVFKYLAFSLSAANRLLRLSLPVPEIALPIGISFFTFQAISYLADVYRGDVSAQRNPLYLGLYISFFPQLIAGPIVRYKTVAEEIASRTVSADDLAEGVKLFLIGFLKKVLLANPLSVAADAAFAAAEASVATRWLGLICYALQILFDFAGYSEMAVGLGRMFGFHFMKNFDDPYMAASISEFWRRWHISLGTWFRDYVYIPLGGSRVGRGRLVLNLLIVWGLTGVWHGANWTFLLWGLWYFALLTFEKLTGLPKRLPHGWQRGLYRAFTLLCVALGWVLFRAEGVGAALGYLRGMLGAGATALSDKAFWAQLRECLVPLCAALWLCTPLTRRAGERLRAAGTRVAAVYGALSAAGYLLLFAVAVAQLILGAHNPFIYFNF